MSMFVLRPSSIVLPSYAWRAPAWTNARRYPALYDDYAMLLVECALLDELEPDLQSWAASRRGLPPPVDPLDEHDDERPLEPQDYLRELESVRSEVRAVFKAICRPLQASYDASEVYDELVKGIFDFWRQHLDNDPKVIHRLIPLQATDDKLALLREALGGKAGSFAAEDDLAALERLGERHAEHRETSRRGPEERKRHVYANSDLYDRVHLLVRRIHQVRAHPVERTIPRAPPCDPERSPADAFVLPIGALRLLPRYVRDLAELDAFFASGRMPRAAEYLPAPEERFATMVRARGVLCDLIEQGAKACLAYDEPQAERRALGELRILCLDIAGRCGVFGELGPAALRLDDEEVHDVAAELLGVLLSSDHPLASHAMARISAAMALTPRDVTPAVPVNVRLLHASEEQHELIWQAKSAVYEEVPDEVLY